MSSDFRPTHRRPLNDTHFGDPRFNQYNPVEQNSGGEYDERGPSPMFAIQRPRIEFNLAWAEEMADFFDEVQRRNITMKPAVFSFFKKLEGLLA